MTAVDRLGRPDAWPDDFDDWLEQCHRAGNPDAGAVPDDHGGDRVRRSGDLHHPRPAGALGPGLVAGYFPAGGLDS
jgi:hypothetical protein